MRKIHHNSQQSSRDAHGASSKPIYKSNDIRFVKPSQSIMKIPLATIFLSLKLHMYLSFFSAPIRIFKADIKLSLLSLICWDQTMSSCNQQPSNLELFEGIITDEGVLILTCCFLCLKLDILEVGVRFKNIFGVYLYS